MSSTERYRLIEQLPDLIPCEATQTWLGTDLTLDRAVTIRLTEVDSEAGLRLRLQTQSLAAFEHPALLHILDTYISGRQFAIVTERLPPHTLADELAEDGEFPRLSELEALQAAATAAEGLHALHGAGFTHGGVSAAQIGRRREGGFILLTGPPTGDAIAIPATRKDDIRSLAALAHELLVGAPPEGRNGNSWRINSAVSPAMKSVLKRACSEDDPWPDAGALMVEFKDAAKELNDKHLAARDLAAREQAAGDLTTGGQAAGKLTAERPEATSSATVRRIKKIARNGWTAVVVVLIIGATVLGGGAWLLAQSNTTDAVSADTGQADNGQADSADGSNDGANDGAGGNGADGSAGADGGSNGSSSDGGAGGNGAGRNGAGGNGGGNSNGAGAGSASGNGGDNGNSNTGNANTSNAGTSNANTGNANTSNTDTGNTGANAGSGTANDPNRNDPSTNDPNPNDPNPNDELTRVPAEIALITDFDPLGDDVIEHPELLLLLNDGDPLTGWRTSLYNTADFGGLKEGVGLLVELGGDSVPEIARVVIESPSIGWTFQLLASDQRRATQIEWGEPVAEVTVERSEPITLSFPAPDEGSLRAATLLLWITDLGEELEAGGYRVTINGIRISRYHQP